jgi:hypothetical protein
MKFPTAYTKAKEYCQRPDRQAQLEQAVQKLTGRPWSLRIETVADPPGMASGSGAARKEAGEPNGAPAGPRARRNAREEAEKLPLIRRALDVLGATITRVDEGFGEAPPRREAGTEEAER